MPTEKPIIYHRHWPRLLKEAVVNDYKDPITFVWDNVEDERASDVGYDVYSKAIIAWCETRPEAVYQNALTMHRAA